MPTMKGTWTGERNIIYAQKKVTVVERRQNSMEAQRRGLRTLEVNTHCYETTQRRHLPPRMCGSWPGRNFATGVLRIKDKVWVWMGWRELSGAKGGNEQWLMSPKERKRKVHGLYSCVCFPHSGEHDLIPPWLIDKLARAVAMRIKCM